MGHRLNSAPGPVYEKEKLIKPQTPFPVQDIALVVDLKDQQDKDKKEHDLKEIETNLRLKLERINIDDEAKKKLKFNLDNADDIIKEIEYKLTDEGSESFDELKKIYFEDINKKIDFFESKNQLLQPTGKQMEYEVGKEVVKLRNMISHANKLDDCVEIKDEVIKLMLQAKGFGINNPQDVFEFLFDEKYTETEREKLLSIGDKGQYLPFMESANSKLPHMGADFWVDKKIGDLEYKAVVDSTKHGYGYFHQMLFIKKAYELFVKESILDPETNHVDGYLKEQIYEKNIIKLDSIFGEMNSNGCETGFNSIQVKVMREKEGGVMLNVRENGDCAILIKKKGGGFLYRGIAIDSVGDVQKITHDYVHLDEKDNKNALPAGNLPISGSMSMILDMGIKKINEVVQKAYEIKVEDGDQVIIFTDDLKESMELEGRVISADKRKVIKEGRNIIEELNKFSGTGSDIVDDINSLSIKDLDDRTILRVFP